MNAGPDVEQLLSDWLDEEAPARAPDRILLTAADRLDHTRQWRFGVTWRFIPMNGNGFRVAAAAVIGVLLLGGAYYLFGGGGGPDVGAPATSTPTLAPSASAAVVPAASPTADLRGMKGTILLEHFGNAFDGSEAANEPNAEIRRFYLINPDGSGLREFMPGQPAGGKDHASLSPDGTKVAFASHGNADQIWLAAIDGDAPVLVSAACQCHDDFPAFAPDGLRIVFSHYDGKTASLAIRDLATGKVTPLDSTGVQDPATDGTGGGPEQPRWSPDGTQIVYRLVHIDVAGKLTSSQLMIYDIASGESHEIDLALADVGDASWSPDGSRILFAGSPLYSSAGISPSSIFSVRPDGSDLQQLTESATQATGAPSWTPDGRILYFHNNLHGVEGSPQMGRNGLWLMDADGSNQAPLSNTFPDLGSTTNGWAYYGYWVPTP